MALPQFSETQFVFGFLKELYLRNVGARLIPWGSYFMFPTLIAEKKFPVDFFIKHFSHSEFYQFKLSTSVGNGLGRKPLLRGVPVSYQPFYRFKIYNDSSKGKGQFELLRALAAAYPGDLVCYSAPCFHEESEYFNLFNGNQIINNSILIECGQFNHAKFSTFNVNDGQDHFLSYKLNTTSGYLCSETPYEIKVIRGSEVPTGNYSEMKFDDYLDKLASVLPKDFRDYKGGFELSVGPESEWIQRALIMSEYLLSEKNIIWLPYFSINRI